MPEQVNAKMFLTSADPEPPRGTTVETVAGTRWSRDYSDEGHWFADDEQRSWADIVRIAPVRVVQRPAYALTDDDVAEIMCVSFGEEPDRG